MRDKIEPDERETYVAVAINGVWTDLTYHTFDELSELDDVRICGGQLEGETGIVTEVGIEPPSRHGEPIATYRVEKLVPAPHVVAVETVRTWSDGSVTHETVWSES